MGLLYRPGLGLFEVVDEGLGVGGLAIALEDLGSDVDHTLVELLVTQVDGHLREILRLALVEQVPLDHASDVLHVHSSKRVYHGALALFIELFLQKEGGEAHVFCKLNHLVVFVEVEVHSALGLFL